MGGVTTRHGVGAGEARVDPATLMILRALAGERGKVEIGGRPFGFSCVTTFRLVDERTGEVHLCDDSVGLLRKILDLLRDAREKRYRRNFTPSPSG